MIFFDFETSLAGLVLEAAVGAALDSFGFTFDFAFGFAFDFG